MAVMDGFRLLDHREPEFIDPWRYHGHRYGWEGDFVLRASPVRIGFLVEGWSIFRKFYLIFSLC